MYVCTLENHIMLVLGQLHVHVHVLDCWILELRIVYNYHYKYMYVQYNMLEICVPNNILNLFFKIIAQVNKANVMKTTTPPPTIGGGRDDFLVDVSGSGTSDVHATTASLTPGAEEGYKRCVYNLQLDNYYDL